MSILIGVFVKNVPLAKDFGRKIYPWLNNIYKNTPLAKESGPKTWSLGAAQPQ